MAKAILEFEIDDPEGQRRAITALKAPQLVEVLADIDTFIRNMRKYETLSDETADRVDSIRRELHELMDFKGVIEVIFTP